MASKTTFIVQAFGIGRGGVLRPGKSEVTPTASGAVKKAEAWSAREKGVVAFEVSADDETGAVNDAKLHAQHGQVTDDFIEQVKGG